MLSEQEIQQICRKYDIVCPICGVSNTFNRLKRDIFRATETEGDGHPIKWRWAKSGFDSVDPKTFFFGTCKNCSFTGELEDAEFRTASRNPDLFKAKFNQGELLQLVNRTTTGKGVAQDLGRRVKEDHGVGGLIAQFHLGIYTQCLLTRIVPGNIARFYLRLAWLYRDKESFYASDDFQALGDEFVHFKEWWDKDLPLNDDFPEKPGIALSEAEALFFARVYFERNFETLRQANQEDELRLQYLLAEIGFRLYELTSSREDYTKASAFFSSTMQRSLDVINDKTVVGGMVNRAREMLEVCGERGRQLRALRDSKDGESKAGKKVKKSKAKKTLKRGEKKVAEKADERAAGDSPPKKKKKKKKKADLVAESASRAEMPQADLDGIMRKTALLEEELEVLKERHKTVEEDNLKWRQLAGRDALTGLGNKIMLFNVVLPKILKKLEPGRSFSCIAIGLDQLGQVNLKFGWKTGDQMLLETVKNLRRLTKEGEELYRLDGAIFGFLCPGSGDEKGVRATELRRHLAQTNVKVANNHLPLISSVGVVSVERRGSASASEAAAAISKALFQILFKAKDQGGNTVEIHSSKHF